MSKSFAGAACRAVDQHSLEEALHPAVKMVLSHGVVVAREGDQLLLAPILVMQLLRMMNANEGVFPTVPCMSAMSVSHLCHLLNPCMRVHAMPICKSSMHKRHPEESCGYAGLPANAGAPRQAGG